MPWNDSAPFQFSRRTSTPAERPLPALTSGNSDSRTSNVSPMFARVTAGKSGGTRDSRGTPSSRPRRQSAATALGGKRQPRDVVVGPERIELAVLGKRREQQRRGLLVVDAVARLPRQPVGEPVAQPEARARRASSRCIRTDRRARRTSRPRAVAAPTWPGA